MAFYVNNGSSGVHGGYTWGAGSDSNDGLSPATPFLTGDVALDAVSSGDADIVFRSGTGSEYEYTNGSGRKIMPNADFSLSADDINEVATLHFVGTGATQGLRFNCDTTERTATITKGIRLKGSGTIQQVVYMNDGSASGDTYVNFGSKIVITEGNNCGLYLISDRTNVTLVDGFGFENEAAVTTAPSLGLCYIFDVIGKNIDIQSCDMEGYTGKIGDAIIHVEYQDVSAGSCSVMTPKGVCNPTDTTNFDIVWIENAPDGAEIILNETFVCNVNDGVSNYGYVIESLATDGLSANNARIYSTNGAKQIINTQDGVLASIGRDGSVAHNCDNGVIENINIYGKKPTELTGALHGVCHFGCTGGYQSNNKVGGANLPSLIKEGQAVSSYNKLYDIKSGSTSAAYLYAKAGQAGTAFIGNVCVINDDFSGKIEQALENDATGNDSSDVEFRGTIVEKGNGDINSSAQLALIGTGGTDLSTGSSYSLRVDDGLTLPSTIASIRGVDYASIALANATVDVEHMEQTNILRFSTNTAFSSHLITDIQGNPL